LKIIAIRCEIGELHVKHSYLYIVGYTTIAKLSGAKLMCNNFYGRNLSWFGKWSWEIATVEQNLELYPRDHSKDRWQTPFNGVCTGKCEICIKIWNQIAPSPFQDGDIATDFIPTVWPASYIFQFSNLTDHEFYM